MAFTLFYDFVGAEKDLSDSAWSLFALATRKRFQSTPSSDGSNQAEQAGIYTVNTCSRVVC
jgi:hypothetical protein